MSRERGHHYGYGHWPRNQLYAIVASYWRQGRTSIDVARRLGISRKFAEQIFEYLEWSETVDELEREECERSS